MSIITKLGITEGPWEARELDGRNRTFFLGAPKLGPGNNTTDARLISSAPEMLEALIKYMDAVMKKGTPLTYLEQSAYIEADRLVIKATEKSWEQIKKLREES